MSQQGWEIDTGDKIALLCIANDSYLSAGVENGELTLKAKGDPALETEGVQNAFQNLINENLIHVASLDNPGSPTLAALQPTTQGLKWLIRAQREFSKGRRYRPGEVSVRRTESSHIGMWDVMEAEVFELDCERPIGTLVYAAHSPVEDMPDFIEAIIECPLEGYCALPGLIQPAARSILVERLESSIEENPLRILIIDQIRINSSFLGRGAGQLALRQLMKQGDCKTASIVTPFPLNYSFPSKEEDYLKGLAALKRFYESMGFNSFHPEQTIMVSIS